MIAPDEIINELRRLTAEMEKGARFLYEAEVKLAHAEADYDMAFSKALLNASGSIPQQTAIAKMETATEKLAVDLLKAEVSRVKMKMKVLSETATATAVQFKAVELTWRTS